jgi:anti-sigma factor RsiW
MNMCHLRDHTLVALVFDEIAAEERRDCRLHMETCSKCQAAFEALAHAAAVLEKNPNEPAPPFAWARLKARVEKSRSSRDWAEPAWTPLVLGNIAGIVLVLALISLTGGWLEKAPVWQEVQTWPLAAQFGPRSLAAVLFFGIGALVTLAMTPILWWESCHPQKGIIK